MRYYWNLIIMELILRIVLVISEIVGSKDPAKENSRLSKAHLHKIALHMDHVVELEVTDWAGESDLTVTLSRDSSRRSTLTRVVLAADFDAVIGGGRGTGRRPKSAAALAGCTPCSARSSPVMRSIWDFFLGIYHPGDILGIYSHNGDIQANTGWWF